MAHSVGGSPAVGVATQLAVGQRWMNRDNPAEIIVVSGRGLRLERWVCSPVGGGRVWLLTADELRAQYERVESTSSPD